MANIYKESTFLAMKIYRGKIDQFKLNVDQLRGIQEVLPHLSLKQEDKEKLKKQIDFVICKKEMTRYFLEQRAEAVKIANKLIKVQTNVFNLSNEQLQSIQQIIDYIQIDSQAKLLLQRQITFGLKMKQSKSASESLNQTINQLKQSSDQSTFQYSIRENLIVQQQTDSNWINQISRITKNQSLSPSPSGNNNIVNFDEIEELKLNEKQEQQNKTEQVLQITFIQDSQNNIQSQ